MSQEKTDLFQELPYEQQAYTASYLNFFEVGRLGVANRAGKVLASEKAKADFEARFPGVNLTPGLSYQTEYSIRHALSCVLSQAAEVPGQDIAALCMLMRDDKQFYLSLAASDLLHIQRVIHYYFIKHASDALKNDYTVAMTAIQGTPLALEFVSERLQGNLSVVTAAVGKHGAALKFALGLLESNFDVVMLALKTYSQAIEFVSDDLKTNPRVQAAYAERLHQESLTLEQGTSRTRRVDGEAELFSWDTIDEEEYESESLNSPSNLFQPGAAAAEEVNTQIQIPSILKTNEAAVLLSKLLDNVPESRRSNLPSALLSCAFSFEPEGPPPSFQGP